MTNKARTVMDGATILVLLVIGVIGTIRGLSLFRDSDQVTLSEGLGPKPPSRAMVEVGTGIAVGAGPRAATLIVFHDMACGWCAEQDSILRLVMRKYPDQLRIIYKDFVENESAPVFETHVAGQCVAKQGKYSEFLRLGYRNPDLTNISSGWREILTTIPGIDSAAVEDCVSATDATERVRANTVEARQRGLTMTPSSVADGRLFEGSLTLDVADSVVVSMISRRRRH